MYDCPAIIDDFNRLTWGQPLKGRKLCSTHILWYVWEIRAISNDSARNIRRPLYFYHKESQDISAYSCEKKGPGPLPSQHCTCPTGAALRASDLPRKEPRCVCSHQSRSLGLMLWYFIIIDESDGGMSIKARQNKTQKSKTEANVRSESHGEIKGKQQCEPCTRSGQMEGDLWETTEGSGAK